MNNLESNSMTVMSQVLGLIGSLPFADVPAEVAAKLAQLPRTEVLASLKKLTYSEDTSLSDRAMSAILQIDPEFGKSVLLELRTRPDWEWFFCYAALGYGDDSFVSPLCEILLKSQDANARFMAVVALERLGNPASIESLTLALEDPGEDYEGRKISRRANIALNAIRERAIGTDKSSKM